MMRTFDDAPQAPAAVPQADTPKAPAVECPLHCPHRHSLQAGPLHEVLIATCLRAASVSKHHIAVFQALARAQLPRG